MWALTTRQGGGNGGGGGGGGEMGAQAVSEWCFFTTFRCQSDGKMITSEGKEGRKKEREREKKKKKSKNGKMLRTVNRIPQLMVVLLLWEGRQGNKRSLVQILMPPPPPPPVGRAKNSQFSPWHNKQPKLILNPATTRPISFSFKSNFLQSSVNDKLFRAWPVWLWCCVIPVLR